MSQLLTQIQDLQNKVNSLTDAREFYDPETASRLSGTTHVPSQPLNTPSPREMLSRDSERGALQEAWQWPRPCTLALRASTVHTER